MAFCVTATLGAVYAQPALQAQQTLSVDSPTMKTGAMMPRDYTPDDFVVYALDAALDLRPNLTRAELLEAIDGHVIGEAEIVPVYERK
jgi:hypothetical protein